MKAAIVGQQDFGKAVLEAMLARGDEITAVFCAPEKEGARADTLRVAAQEKGIKVYQFKSLKAPEAVDAMKAANADIGIMAYVLQFAPQDFVNIPKHGTIQYHPSLLPKYRGPSSISWPIICGEKETGLTIFRPSDGLDEGAIILQKKTPIGPDDTLGSIYFDRLFPMGVAAMLEAADQVLAGRHTETVQDESQATYEGWCRDAESKINWANHSSMVYNLIRGCSPAPGAWTTFNGVRLWVYEARLEKTATFGAVKGRIGEVVESDGGKLVVSSQSGRIHVLKGKLGEGKKMAGDALGIAPGSIFGT